MFILKKILTPFLLPPGIFVLAAILWGLAYVFRKQIRTGILLVFLGFSMWLLAITPTSNMLLRGLEKDFLPPKLVEGDVLILLGGGINDEVADLTGVGSPSDESLARLVTAVRLHHRLKAPVIVSGGKVYNHANSEAQVARRFLIDLGISPERIIIEDQSRDTFENALYSIKICERNNYRKPILITSAYHMKRALMNFKKAGMTVVPFPAAYKTWQNRKFGWHDYLPESFDGTQSAIREYLGLIYTRLLL
ncbi:MAG: YdcF family protein [Thermodesulfobacteriota bacterium]